MDSLIQIIDINKSYKDKSVLCDINLQLKKGKGYGFIGHNGCGKSLLFKVICGFVRPTSGKVIIDNMQIGEDVDLIKDAGVIIETPEFIHDISGLKNLQMLAQIKNVVTKEEILQVLEQLGLLNVKDKKYNTYSLGMKQRLRIAQAIMEKPSILILDEPMNSLDKNTVLIVRSILKDHKNNGGTLLLTSHNSEDIEELCDVIFEMENGKIVMTYDKLEQI